MLSGQRLLRSIVHLAMVGCANHWRGSETGRWHEIISQESVERHNGHPIPSLVALRRYNSGCWCCIAWLVDMAGRLTVQVANSRLTF
jgi:hypothetical protein